MSAKLFVGGVPYHLEEQDLRDLFSQYGNIAEGGIKLIDKTEVDPMTQREKRKKFAFIEMSSADEANAAIAALDGYEFEDASGRKRSIKVSIAEDRQPNRNFNNNRGGGYNRDGGNRGGQRFDRGNNDRRGGGGYSRGGGNYNDGGYGGGDDYGNY